MPETDTAVALNDGMTEAERNFFSSGGEVSDALLAENKDVARSGTEPSVTPPEPTPPAAPTAPEATAAQETTPASGQEPPAVGEEAEESAPEPGKPPRRVSWAKFQAAEEARQAAERKLQEQALTNARVEERLSLLQQALADPEAAKPAKEKPDPEKDIFGYARYLEEQLTEVAGKVNGYEQQIQQGQAEMEEERRYFDALNSFAGREPNFLQAYTYLLRSRAAELMAPRYPQANFDQLMQAEIPPDVADMLRQEERDLYKTAFHANRSPADDIFRLAQVRGFRPRAATPAQNGNGATASGAAAPAAHAARAGTPLAATPAVAAAPAAVPAAPGTPTATDLVASIQKGQSAAMSLSNASGGTGIELTPQVLGNMSDEEFSALYNELSARGDKQKLMDLFGH